MQLVNQHEIYETWAPIIESKTGLTEGGKVEWLSTYCTSYRDWETCVVS